MSTIGIITDETRAVEQLKLDRVVIVGASLAGLRAAETLRGDGYVGELIMIGAERHLPYDRPPLSKQVLSGAWEPERTTLRRPEVFEALDINWQLGVSAVALDTQDSVIEVGNGSTVNFDGLIIATGTTPVRLPDAMTSSLTTAGPAVVELRTLDDAIELRSQLVADPIALVVIGAGFIGLEVAASARQLGHRVTVVEAGPAPLMRGLGIEMGRAVAACHGDHEVDILCDTKVTAVDDRGVVLDSGEVLPADVVVVGIGVRPAIGWLEGSGLLLDDGVVADAYLNVGVPGIYAAGDVVRWPHPLVGETIRIEHWSNAAEQGADAAKNLLAESGVGEARVSGAVPFFWSDQYDRRIQFLGRAAPDDTAKIVVGSIQERSFVALYGRGDRLVGVLGVNQPKRVMPFRKLLEEQISMADAMAMLEAAANDA